MAACTHVFGHLGLEDLLQRGVHKLAQEVRRIRERLLHIGRQDLSVSSGHRLLLGSRLKHQPSWRAVATFITSGGHATYRRFRTQPEGIG